MQKLRKVFNISLYLIGFFVLIGNIVYAQQIPHFIKYQGDGKKILEEIEKGGKEKDKGKEKDLYTLTFRIYNIKTGGVALWKEIHLNVPIKKEKFEVLLGSFTPLDLRFDEDYWLSIAIDSKGEIEPRERMTSFGYAYMSEDSYKLGGRYPDDFALFGHSHIGEDVVSPVAEAINADTVDGLHADQIGGIRDHGLLEGLADDDHLQYLNILRGDERYAGAGWDGLTKLKTAQDHIVDKNNPHAVTLEQLGHLDNNTNEEAPTATERGEPTGVEIQGWADDIMSWGHSNLVASLNADKLDGKDSTEFSLLGHFHTLMDLSDVTSELRAAFLAAGTAGASGNNRLATMTDIGGVSGLWTDEGTYIYPNNIGSGFQIRDTGNLIVNGKVGIGTGTIDNLNTMLAVGNFELESRVTVRSSDIAFLALLKNPQYPTNLAQTLISTLQKDTLQTGDTNQIRLGFVANDDGGGSPDRRFFTAIEAMVEDPNNITRKAGLRFLTTTLDGRETERMRLTDSGNVGINTAAPNAKLHVNKDSGANHTEVARFVAANPGAMPYITVGNSNTGGENAPTCGGGYFAYDNPSGTVWIGEHCNAPAIIVDAGNVSIGTAVQQGTLDVNGPIYQRGSLLHADYVFEPDYKLESIEEHSNYMWQEKHLKAVPKSAKTEEGQEIMEMGSRQRGVLEELEKAHIYIVQLNERIKKLEEKIK